MLENLLTIDEFGMTQLEHRDSLATNAALII